MQSALRNDQFPRIEFTLTDMTFKGPHEAGKPFAFDTSGDLEIAGVTNKVSFPVTIEVVDGKKIKVNASVPLKMTDFKIDPPAPNIGLGLMKCADAVTIVLDWTLMERK
jgi:polyisoprenoid-binding protein YceI